MKLFAFLLAFALVAVALIIIGAWRAGKKQLKEDYDTKYRTLRLAVRYADVTAENFVKIEQMFTEIGRFACRDKERLDVLLREFQRKYWKFYD